MASLITYVEKLLTQEKIESGALKKEREYERGTLHRT